MPLYPGIEPCEQGMLPVGEGNTVYWECCGNPKGKPALVLHGGPGSGCTPLHRRFFDPDTYRIMLFDQRNCGRSTPHASEPGIDLSANSTWRLVSDIERVREHLGVDRWLVFGQSWGVTLALVYAEAHPHRVSELVLGGVTMTRPHEVEWLYGGLARFFPGQYDRFRGFARAPASPHDLIAAYHKLLFGGDPPTRARAAEEWCRWESVSVSVQGGPELAPRFRDPAYALCYARLVTHFFAHNAWLEDGQVLRGAAALRDIPGVLVNGRLDLQAPLATAWELKQAWPRAELVVVENAGHSLNDPGIPDALVAATDRFARA